MHGYTKLMPKTMFTLKALRSVDLWVRKCEISRFFVASSPRGTQPHTYPQISTAQYVHMPYVRALTIFLAKLGRVVVVFNLVCTQTAHARRPLFRVGSRRRRIFNFVFLHSEVGTKQWLERLLIMPAQLPALYIKIQKL